MAEHFFGQGQTQRHEKYGPIYGMETDNVFADDMHITGPVFLEQGVIGMATGVIPQCGDIVGQGIQPDINHMFRIKFHRNTPGKAGSGNAQIRQPWLEEIVDHFFLSGFGGYEIRIGFDVLFQLFLVFGHLEKVGFFFGFFCLSPAFGANAVMNLGIGEKGFARGAIPSFIFTFIDVTLGIQLIENGCHGFFMIFIGGPDEFVVGGIHQIPHFPDFACHLVHIFLGMNPGFFGTFLYFYTVFIGTRQEKNIFPNESLIPGNGVRKHHLIGVADMRLAGCIRNRRGQIKFFFHGDPFLSLDCSQKIV